MKKRIPFTVFVLGLVSFFNDIASEMVYPITPIFLTSVLHTPIEIVGLIEGVAEATASLSKFIFGALADYFKRRKIFVVLGYSFTGAAKILVGAAQTWPLVLFGRFIDRFGKGLRTAPRDSILLENTTSVNRGFIFGFHRAFDSLGAVFGPLMALVLLSLLKENMRLVFFVAFVPSAIGVLLLILFVKEKNKIVVTKNQPFLKISWQTIPFHLKMFFLANLVFALGNSSDAFLILKAKALGLTTTFAVLTYVLYNTSQTIFATPAGSLADKIGAQKVFAGGLVVFAIVYFFFGFIHQSIWVWLLFPIYGVYIAATDGVSKAYLSQFIQKDVSGTYFGIQQTLLAIGSFLASFVGGIIWQQIGSSWTFYYGAIMALFAFVLFVMTQRRLTSK